MRFVLLLAQQTTQTAQTTQTTVSLTAVWIGAGVALLGALIAAGTAQWRQRVALRHERELSDLTELRQVLDEAAALSFEALEQLRPLFHAWARSRQPLDNSADDEMRTLLKRMELMAARLALRVGEGHLVYVHFAQCLMACRDVTIATVSQTYQEPDEQGPGVGKQLDELRRTFIEAAQQLVGSQLKVSRRR